MKKHGFTLMEVITVLTIGTTGMLVVKDVVQENHQEAMNEETVRNITSIVDAVDYRLAIDGYNTDNWSSSSWEGSEGLSDLITSELNQADACEGGSWTPEIGNPNVKESLVSCDTFGENKLDQDYTFSAELETDSNNFIDSFNVLLRFNSEESFSDNFVHLKMGLNKSLTSNDKKMSGYTTTQLVEAADPNNILTSQECIELREGCAIKALYERQGKGSFVRSNLDSVIYNSSLSFVVNAGDAPLDCARWKSDGSGNWEMSDISDENCGIGLFDGEPLVVEVNVETGTFENIALNKQCAIYEWGSSGLVNSGRLSPCGVFNNGTEIVQVLDRTVANVAEIQQVFVDEGFITNLEVERMRIELADIENLFADTLNARYVSALDRFVSNKEFVANGMVSVFDEGVIKSKSHIDFTNGAEVLSLDAERVDIAGVKGKIERVSGGILESGSISSSTNKIEEAEIKGAIFDNVYVSNSIEIEGDLTNAEIISENLIVPDINIKHLVVVKEMYSTEMSAPIGNFANYNKELADIESDYNRISAELDRNEAGALNAKNITTENHLYIYR